MKESEHPDRQNRMALFRHLKEAFAESFQKSEGAASCNC